jgi:hypothetical protein
MGLVEGQVPATRALTGTERRTLCLAARRTSLLKTNQPSISQTFKAIRKREESSWTEKGGRGRGMLLLWLSCYDLRAPSLKLGGKPKRARRPPRLASSSSPSTQHHNTNTTVITRHNRSNSVAYKLLTFEQHLKSLPVAFIQVRVYMLRLIASCSSSSGSPRSLCCLRVSCARPCRIVW